MPTADARVLPGGTALVCDTGMVGSWDSVLGLDPAVIVGRFRDGMPRRFQVGSGPVAFNSVLVDVDETTGRARSIARVDREVAAAT